jgi:hypothetical protein
MGSLPKKNKTGIIKKGKKKTDKKKGFQNENRHVR